MTLEEAIPEDGLITPRNLGIKEAAILAFKDHRLTKTALVRVSHKYCNFGTKYFIIRMFQSS